MTDINSSGLDEAIEQGGGEIIRDGLKQGDVAVVTGARPWIWPRYRNAAGT